MPSVVYVVRSPIHTLSPALFSENGSGVVLSLEDPLLPGKVLRTANDTRIQEGAHLSYEQVLAIVLDSKKVMTL
jgi:hypothetical protein